jgi:hypothetical protein
MPALPFAAVPVFTFRMPGALIIAACVALGVAGVFLPWERYGSVTYSLWEIRGQIPGNLVQVGIGLLAALVVAVVTLVRPPAGRWRSMIALTGFLLVLIPVRQGWAGAIGGKLLFTAAVAGLAASAVIYLRRSLESA